MDTAWGGVFCSCCRFAPGLMVGVDCCFGACLEVEVLECAVRGFVSVHVFAELWGLASVA